MYEQYTVKEMQEVLKKYPKDAKFELEYKGKRKPVMVLCLKQKENLIRLR